MRRRSPATLLIPLPTRLNTPHALAHGFNPTSSQGAQAAGIILSREQASLTDSDASTTQTIARMSDHIRAAHGDPAVVRVAGECLRMAGGSMNPAQRAKAVWYWCKAHIQFVHDDTLIRRLFGERDQLELLIEPRVLLRQARPKGDCDDFTMAVCALLWELGLDAQICTIKGDHGDRRRWSHVYARCPLAGLVMDCSHGKRPGWEAPYFWERGVWDAETGMRVE